MEAQSPVDDSQLFKVVPALQETPGFQPGQQVRVLERYPLGHYRVPLYLRGRIGTVERLVQPAIDNEEEGFGLKRRREAILLSHCRPAVRHLGRLCRQPPGSPVHRSF